MYLNFNDPKTGLINAVTGKIIYNSIVNVEKSYELRKKLQQFESSLPGGYHNAISRIIIKMDAAKKGIGKAEEKDFRPRAFSYKGSRIEVGEPGVLLQANTLF